MTEIAILTDDFNDNYLDPKIWLITSVSDARVAEQNQRLEVSTPPDRHGLAIISTVPSFDVADYKRAIFTVEIVANSGSPDTVARLQLTVPGSTYGFAIDTMGNYTITRDVYTLQSGSGLSPTGKIKIVIENVFISELIGYQWRIRFIYNDQCLYREVYAFTSLRITANLEAEGTGSLVAFDNFGVYTGYTLIKPVMAKTQPLVINFNIEDGYDIGGFELHAKWDPTLLRCESVENGDYLTLSPFIVGPTIDNTNGTLTLYVVQNGGQPSRSGSGILATATFTILKGGSTTIDPTGTLLAEYPPEGQVSAEPPKQVETLTPGYKLTVQAFTAEQKAITAGFTIDTTSKTTPYEETLLPADYKIAMDLTARDPATGAEYKFNYITVNGEKYPEGQNEVTITLDRDKTVTAYYQLPFDFKVEVSPTSAVAIQGETILATVTVTLVSGTPQTVTLTAENLPPDTTAEFTPTSGTPTFQSMLKLVTSKTTPTGQYIITIKGTGGGLTRTATFTLTVIPPFSKVYGRVTGLFGSPIAGAKVTLNTYVTTTDADGNYVIPQVKEGTYVLMVTPPPPLGLLYYTYTESMNIAAGQVYRKDVKLSVRHLTIITIAGVLIGGFTYFSWWKIKPKPKPKR
jgi:hypothetical protein